MANSSEPTPRNRFRLQGTGENRNQWGSRLNEVLRAADKSLDGRETIAVTGGTLTLSAGNYDATAQAIARALRFTGVLGATQTVVIPDREKWYFVRNDTTGSYGLTIKTASGNPATIKRSAWVIVFCDGTAVEARTDARLDTLDAPQGPVDLAGQRLTSVAPGVAPSDAATIGQIASAYAGTSPLVHAYLHARFT